MARVLIVDDDRDVLAVLRAGLQARGHEAIAFSDPVEARAWLSARAPDGVLLDVRMPAVSGWELLGEIRGSQRTGHLPVIMLSANGDVSERIRGLRLGADDFCVKPFHVDEVVARVEGLLARRNRPQSSIQGDLATFPLADVLQSIEQQKRTGTLGITAGEAEASATYRRGRCIAATCDGLDGREALLELLSLASGTFRFVEDPLASLDETLGGVAGPWLLRASELLLENAWIEDELARRRELLPQDETWLTLGEGPIVPEEQAGPTALPALPFAEIARAFAARSPIEMGELRRGLGCCRARAALAFGVLLGSGALRVAMSTPTESTSPGAELDDVRLLDRLRAEVPGFLSGAVVEPLSLRVLASVAVTGAPDPGVAASDDSAAIRGGLPAAASSPVEEVLYILSDELHLHLTTPEGNVLFVAAERSSSANPAPVRNAVARTLSRFKHRHS